MPGNGIDERALKEAPTWQHLTSVVAHMAIERPANSIEIIESFSHSVLNGKPLPSQTTSVYADERPKPKKLLPVGVQQQTEWATNFGLQLVPPKPVKKSTEEEDEAPEEETEDKGELADVVSEQQNFQRVGEGLSESESFRVSVALKRLLDKEPLAKARFWGKIFGSRRDYYIAETKIDENRVPEKEENQEEPAEIVGKAPETIYQALNTYGAREAIKAQPEEAGKGVNENRYYVATSDDLTEWFLLPDVRPEHIAAARQIQKAFTGDLSAVIDTHPQFPGLEKHYLRAQIARISQGCTVAPKDVFVTEGAVEEEEEDDEGNKKPRRFEVKAYEELPPINPQEPPDAEDAEAIAPVKSWFYGYKADELLEGKSWVHIGHSLLAEGRCSKFKPEDEEPQEDEEEEGAVPDNTELIHPFLCEVSNDAALAFEGHSRASFPAWTFRKAYRNESSTTRTYLARSTLWPGALAYAVAEDEKPGAQFQNLYIGNGLKSLKGDVFAPRLPPRTLQEFPSNGIKLMKDCTYDDELEFAPLPPPPVVKGDDEEEQEDE
ncbi:flagellar radial spoke protein, putative [Bodo saltans]|uniref:Flagellar radial spoke protein, putative n=1 Tax=Bodo saltans TaxID=75058 RepID=A0A0S4JES8_BODSA|nr:flagellar radial spoke protein, putative [Bodo saltans]|eukprot:CUG88655.1 flagellar radial spoke protein, putative [Bodo saltans]